MGHSGATRKWPLAFGLIAACLVFVALIWLNWRRTENFVPSHSWALQSGQMSEWKAYGGSWEMANGVVRSDSYERGAKLLSGSRNWGNYTLNVDMRFEGVAADMGVIIRANDES